MFRKTERVRVPVGVPCKVFYDGAQFTIGDDHGIIIASGMGTGTLMLGAIKFKHKKLTILPAKRKTCAKWISRILQH